MNTGRLLETLRLRRGRHGTNEGSGPPRAGSAAFRMMYERFREILARNDATLELIADVTDRLGGRIPFALPRIERRIREAAMDVFVMVKDLNQLGRFEGLYAALRQIDAELQPLLGAREEHRGPLTRRLGDLRKEDVRLVGNKMANLGEVAAAVGLRVPEGFAITTTATARFLTEAGLWARCEQLDEILESDGPAALAAACAEVQAAVRKTPVGEELASAVFSAFEETFPEGSLVAVRSSAVGEDSALASHAGLYDTVLRVEIPRLLDAFRSVVASAYGPSAVSYRFQRGLLARESLMAVGCVAMVEPRCAGVAYSRPPYDPGGDAVVVSATEGLAARLAAGEQDAETTILVPGSEETATSGIVSRLELRRLAATVRALEAHFGTPQDVEWAIGEEGTLTILQARPLATRREESPQEDRGVDGLPALLSGGFVACPGVGSGPVVFVGSDDDLAAFPAGGVLVARRSSPAYSRVMDRCAAIVTDVGTPTGHLASLARELAVPTIVGMPRATEILAPGSVVTVDAGMRRVLAGRPPGEAPRRPPAPLAASPAVAALRRIGAFVTPLRLIDCTSPDFAPEGCRSLHDLVRYVHEKAYEVMFHYGDLARDDRESSKQLEARLPITIRVFDVGGGIAAEVAGATSVTPGQITSVPFRLFLSGLLEERIRWDLPRPVSMRGFLSVLGESMAGLPADARQIGRLSYAIVSDRYMNFSTKAGYHFSTVDTYCGESQSKNYVHFRFSGGAADTERRTRRVRFLRSVLSALDFTVQSRGDLLTARLDKFGSEVIQARLVTLGHLTLCARQLDMLMESDASPELYSRVFLDRDWERF